MVSRGAVLTPVPQLRRSIAILIARKRALRALVHRPPRRNVYRLKELCVAREDPRTRASNRSLPHPRPPRGDDTSSRFYRVDFLFMDMVDGNFALRRWNLRRGTSGISKTLCRARTHTCTHVSRNFTCCTRGLGDPLGRN